jgi:TolB-like protein/DNA-binding winged helix-turn-helix (wHTH) protein/Tfp pilus assembly protein PilF
MEVPAASSRIVHFGVFEVDLKSSELRKQGLRLRLPEQPFQVLTLLLEKPGEVVSRDDLRNRLWKTDTFVDFDHSLNNAVMRLREVLGDSSENPRFVETIPRKGYRFIAQLEDSPLAKRSAGRRESEGTGFGPQPEGSPADLSDFARSESSTPSGATSASRGGSRGRQIAISLVTLFGLVAATFAVWKSIAPPRPATASRLVETTSLMVLPLENLSGDKEEDYFADGMTDELIANLAKIRSLRVVSRSTAMTYKGTRKPLSQIANELHVDALVEGTVLREGNRVRITAELVQVATDHHLWAETYESQLGDVLALQNRVSSAIVSEIRINLTPEDRERLARNPAIAPEAYQHYLKGRFYWNKRSDENLIKAVAYFEKATHEDPHYALAYAALADCYSIAGATIFATLPVREAAPKAREAAKHALDLDPGLAEAETALATSKFNYDWDWPGAEEGFQRAIQLNPSYATAYQRYSLYLMAMGRFQDSLQQISQARELDPFSISINFSLGWRLYMARQYDRAIEQLRNTLEMDSSYELAHLVLGQAYEQKSEFEKAIPELRLAVDLSHRAPLMMSALAHADARAGKRQEAERLLDELSTRSLKNYVSPYYFAVAYSGLGKNDQAMEFLRKAFDDRSNGMVFMKVEPLLDTLRPDPRFLALEQKVKLSQ